MDYAALFGLSGHVAIVTGAGGGIERGIALRFAEAGASVVASDLKLETAEATAREIVSAGGQAIGLACNVTVEDDLTQLVKRTTAAFGTITLLVNNAGGCGPMPFDMPRGDFIWQYQLNVYSAPRGFATRRRYSQSPSKASG